MGMLDLNARTLLRPLEEKLLRLTQRLILSRLQVGLNGQLLGTTS